MFRRYVRPLKHATTRACRPVIERLEERRFLSDGGGAEAVIAPVLPPKQVEYLNRGVVAFRTSASTTGDIYVGWRMLGTDPQANTTFTLYCSTNGGAAVSIGANLATSTNFVHAGQDYSQSHAYYVIPTINGIDQAPSETYTLPANATPKKHIDIPLTPPAPVLLPDGQITYTYNANDTSVGDVDGDGQYEIILKWDPSNSKDNSQSGYTGPVYIDCYRLDGTQLWRINLGQNIRAGAHYTQHVVYDLDGDGMAEVAMRTAPGTIDGAGNPVLMGTDLVTADYRNASGFILTGPEYLTIFNGLTGANMATTAFLPDRGTSSQWGDGGGNRVDRFLGGVAYLDGQRPSLVMIRGYYNASSTSSPNNQARNEITTWDWRGGNLSMRWWFKAGMNINSNINSDFIHGGGHWFVSADVDADGKDEIVHFNNVIDDNGQRLYTTGLGSGDAMMVTDMDLSRPGQESFMVREVQGMYTQNGVTYAGSLHDARTGEPLVPITGTGDVGRGNAFDIDPRYPGFEMWHSNNTGIFNVDGTRIQDKPGNMFQNMAIWWDADPLRELEDGTTIGDWVYTGSGPGGRSNLVSPTGNGSLNDTTGLSSNNGTKSNPGLIADLFGDWREEIIWRQADNLALQIWSTTIVANNRTYTLMHDPQYRASVAAQQTGYNQPTVTSFYLGAVESTGTVMPTIPAANVYVANGTLPSAPAAPTGLATSLLPPQGVGLTWDAVAGATAYRVMRGNVNGGPYTTVAFVDTNSHQDLNLAPGQFYYYVVTAINATGESGLSNQASRAVLGTQTNYQAESGTLAGGTGTSTSGSGFTGSYVTFPATGGSLQLNNINGGAGGMARINIRFSQGYTSGLGTDPGRAGWFYINGVRQLINTRYTGSDGSNWTTLTFLANLNHGLNTLRIESTGQDMGNIDEIQVTVIADTTTPTVVGNPLHGYNSLPNTISFSFSEDVQASLSSGDLIVEQIDLLGGVIGSIPVTYGGYNTGTHTSMFSLNNGLILPNGNYRAALNSGGITDISGNPLSGATPFVFFVLAGDANHDRVIDARDLVILSDNWFGTGKNFSQADFDYDGDVDQADLTVMAQGWQQKLDVPAAPGPAVPTVAGRRTPTRTPVRVIDLVQ